MASLVNHKSFIQTTKENENGILQQISGAGWTASCVFIRQDGGKRTNGGWRVRRADGLGNKTSVPSLAVQERAANIPLRRQGAILLQLVLKRFPLVLNPTGSPVAHTPRNTSSNISFNYSSPVAGRNPAERASSTLSINGSFALLIKTGDILT